MSEQELIYDELRQEAWDTMNRLIEANKNNRETVSQEAILRLGMFFADTSPAPSHHQMQTGTSPFAVYRQLLQRAYALLETLLHPWCPLERSHVEAWVKDAKPLLFDQEKGS